MSVIERTANVQPLERAVFVTDDDRRARRLRRSAFVASALACLWLVGLGIGMLGFGSLPGVSLIKPGHDGKQRSESRAEKQEAGAVVGQLNRSARRHWLSARQAQALARASAARRAAAVPAARRSRPPAAPPAVVAPPAQLPLNPALRQRGWARRSLPAPPGQLRTHPPPPATSQGQRRGQQTTITTTTTPLPPGQAKKTMSPPPPQG